MKTERKICINGAYGTSYKGPKSRKRSFKGCQEQQTLPNSDHRQWQRLGVSAASAIETAYLPAGQPPIPSLNLPWSTMTLKSQQSNRQMWPGLGTRILQGLFRASASENSDRNCVSEVRQQGRSGRRQPAVWGWKNKHALLKHYRPLKMKISLTLAKRISPKMAKTR